MVGIPISTPLVVCLVGIYFATINMAGQVIDVQGHRGCRGLLPENTVPAFIKALDLGVTTLEMDLVISGDRKVVVSHEPYFAADISSLENGKAIDPREEKQYNLYQMQYEEIAAIDVGLKAHPRFPSQQKIKAVKPLFSEVIQKAEAHAKKTDRPLPFYNVEIKRRPEWDNRYHPGAKEFARLVLHQIMESEAGRRIYIQSFDKESLKACKILNDQIPLVLLVEDRIDFEQHIDELGFTPEVYSPYFELVDHQLVEQCKKAGIALIPWTVNQTQDMEDLLDLGVDGIITDYPDRLLELIQQKGYKVK